MTWHGCHEGTKHSHVQPIFEPRISRSNTWWIIPQDHGALLTVFFLFTLSWINRFFVSWLNQVLFTFSGDHGDSLINVSSPSVSLNPPDNEMALDLSSGARERETVKSRSSVTSHMSTGAASHHSYQSEGAASGSTSTSTAVADILVNRQSVFD